MILICWAFPKIITFWSNNFLDWLLTMNECVYCVLKNVYTQSVYAVCSVSMAANVCVRLAYMCGVYARRRKSRAREKTQKKHSKWRRNIPLNGIVSIIWVRSAHVCLTDYCSLMREHFFTFAIRYKCIDSDEELLCLDIVMAMANGLISNAAHHGSTILFIFCWNSNWNSVIVNCLRHHESQFLSPISYVPFHVDLTIYWRSFVYLPISCALTNDHWIMREFGNPNPHNSFFSYWTHCVNYRILCNFENICSTSEVAFTFAPNAISPQAILFDQINVNEIELYCIRVRWRK